MLAITLAVVAGWAASVTVLAHVLRSVLRAHARREGLLVNQILHLSGHTWQEPPRAPEPPVEDEFVLVSPDLYDTVV